MASARDVQDIMGMGGGPVQKPANKKKKKRLVEAQPRLSGISREVQALMGDSVPPVAIVEAPKYKSKPSLAAKLYRPRHWEELNFHPAARADGLVLKHWKRALPLQRTAPPTSGQDVEMADDDQPAQPAAPEYKYEDDFPMEKWNISVTTPKYTDEQYEKHFVSGDWSREETDYLMTLAADYDLRWILIADRYDPDEIQRAESTETDVAKVFPQRTMEQLKVRYYQIAAQDLESRTPKSNMNPTEFQLWERMRNFDAKTETLRKSMAEKLFERTKDEAEEERTLLEELHRITKNEDDFINMRRDLYARLEAAPSLRRNERGEEQNNTVTSQGLGELLNRLSAKEKMLKRRVIPNGEPTPSTANAPAQTPTETKARPSTASRRDTLETPVEKKGSISAPVPKQLSAAEELKYGVTHATERLSSGVSFRHEKINRITTAKSQVQTQKINACLTELEIPARLSMPTEKVCKEFERLVNHIQLLLDARKTFTRVSDEVKTLEEMRRQRLGIALPQEAEGKAETDPAGEVAKETTDGGPGPALNEADEPETEDADASAVDKSAIDDETRVEADDDDEDKDDAENHDDKDDEDEEEEAEEDKDDDVEDAEEEEEDDDDDDEGMAAIRRGARNEAEDDEEPQVDDNEDSGEDEEEDDEDADEDVTMNEVEPAADDPDVEVEASRPTSSSSRGQKRGASVVSDVSGAGSNRSAVGRKRKR